MQKTEAKTEGCCGSTSASSSSKSPKFTDNLFCQAISLSTADKTQKIIKQNLITTKQSSMIGRSPSCSCRDATLLCPTPPAFYCGFFNKAHVTLPKCIETYNDFCHLTQLDFALNFQEITVQAQRHSLENCPPC